MKRTDEDLSKEYVLEQRELGDTYQFQDFTINIDEIWHINEKIGFSPDKNQVDGVLYTHQRTRRPMIILVVPPTESTEGEYQVCYMQKMLSEEGLEVESYCFHILDGGDVGDQMKTLLNLLDEYYSLEMGIIDLNIVSDMIEEMFSFLRQGPVEQSPRSEERKIIKAKRNLPTLAVDSDNI